MEFYKDEDIISIVLYLSLFFPRNSALPFDPVIYRFLQPFSVCIQQCALLFRHCCHTIIPSPTKRYPLLNLFTTYQHIYIFPCLTTEPGICIQETSLDGLIAKRLSVG